MSELLQEYVDSSSQRLRVDRTAGIIHGVKLLGLKSRNGRRYRERALMDAVGLYEGAKVNINHPKGHPLSPRDYQDRLGVVRGVQVRSGEGLFGDLHFNPKHSLSEQLMWDAEHAPQNVGMSHNVLARTAREGEDTVVEAITKVQSIDLVADPATTSGLFEQEESPGRTVKFQEPDNGASAPALDPGLSPLDSLTLECLRLARPDLICEVAQPYEEQLVKLRAQVDEFIARESFARRRQTVATVLEEYGLPKPVGEPSSILSKEFLEALMNAADEKAVRRIVAERAAFVREASQWESHNHAATGRPRSREQMSGSAFDYAKPPANAADFAALIRC